MADKDRNSQGEAMVGKLIAAAGHGPTASPEARNRIYAAVRSHWEEQTREQNAAGISNQTRDAADGKVTQLRSRSRASQAAVRPTVWRNRLIGLAASIAVVAVAVSWLQPFAPGGTSGIAFAEVARIEGSPVILRGGAALTPDLSGTAASILTGDTLRTAQAERIALRLEDGAMLRINASTEVRFVEPEEIELLAGTVYVDSGTGISSRSLRIDTQLGEIEHLGTQYEVNLGDDALRVRVREGRVSVRNDAVETIGVAGEQLELDDSGLTARTPIAADDPAWNWATSLATLPQADEYQLGETLEWVAREQGLTLDYANATSRQRISTQVLYGLEGLSPVETLEVILRTAGIQAEVRDTTLIVTD